MPARKKRVGNYREFPGLDPICFQHPSDREAMERLARLKSVQALLRKLSVQVTEKMFRMLNTAERLRVGPKQCPELYNKVTEVCRILDIKKVPEIYLATHYAANAFSFGIENYTVIFTTALLEMLNEKEQRFLVAHELSHIKCNHMMYRTLLYLLTIVGPQIFGMVFKVAALTFLPLEMKLRAWERKAEFSADRGGLIAVQDPTVAQSALIKLAGAGSRQMAASINIEEILKQADDLTNMDEELLVRAIKLYHNAFRTHPFPIIRIKELHNWSQSNQYRRILAGKYARMDL